MADAAKVLIVEDEQAYAQTLKLKLASSGFEVLHALNGEDGLKDALESHPTLILTDIMMPKMNGMEMVGELRKDGWGQTALIVVLSNTEISKLEAEAAGCLYLIKSDKSLDDIVQLVQEIVEISTYMTTQTQGSFTPQQVFAKVKERLGIA
ncbi:response regulator [candidate division WWE3 bacterium]|uniref:Response regulator n=1 Tax=candidate division WWE3 bacterium TaxID=2053526 RepID=A0A955LKK9_UNCKA|nr:response regulator [candidate division WWE3 bacterium]